MNIRHVVALAFAVPSTLAAIFAACTTLPPLATGYCGDSIIEPDSGEQCDKFPVTIADATYACHAPDSGAAACHIACNGMVCPSGWGCGVDDVCRQPSGQFQSPGTTVSADVRALLLADFNGDGRLDVVTHGAAVSTVSYFDGNATLLGTSSLSIPRGQIVAGSLTGGPNAELMALDSIIYDPSGEAGASIVGTGVDMWRGQGMTLAPTLFPSIAITTAAADCRVMPATIGLQGTQALGQDLLVWTEAPNGMGGLLASVDPLVGAITPMFSTKGAKSVAGDVPVGRLDKTRPCDSAAIGREGDTTVYVFLTCMPNGDAGVLANDGSVPATNISLASALSGPVFLVDTTGGGNLDLVASINPSGAPGGWNIAIAKEDGAGGFAGPVATAVPLLTGPVLGAGFIDGDGLLDYVDATGVALSSTNTIVPSTGVVTLGHVGDVNADGKVDAVAVSTNGIDFWKGSGTAALDHAFYAVPGAKWFAVGDVDGDGVDDVSVVTANTEPALVYVLFGQLGGYPQQPTLLGDLINTQHVAAGHLTWVFGDPPDTIESLVITAVDTNSRLSIVPIQGHADRQLTSPFLLSGLPTAQPGTQTNTFQYLRSPPITGTLANVPISVDAGVYDASLVMLGTSTPDAGSPFGLQIWTAPATVDAEAILSASTLISPVADAQPLATAGVGVRSSAMIALDWDTSRPGNEVLLAVPNGEDDIGGGLFLLALDPTTNVWSVINSDTSFADAFSHPIRGAFLPIRLRSGDFNGDGRTDVLVLYGTVDSDGSDSTGLYAKVIVSDGTAASLAWSKGVSLPIDHDATSGGGITPINVLGNGASQLAVASSAAGGIGFYAFDPVAGLAPLGDASAPFLAVPNLALPNIPIDLIAGDVNGDGIDDLVLGQFRSFTVLLGLPAGP